MKKNVFEKIISNLVFRYAGNEITKDFLQEHYPEGIAKSQKSSDAFTFLYRVLALPGGTDVRDFRNNDCTSKSIESCVRIADDMPSMLSMNGQLSFVQKRLFRFKVPSHRIVLDIDAIMPELKAAAEKYPDVHVYDKYDDQLSASKVLELYEDNEEREVIADLTGLMCLDEDVTHDIHNLKTVLRDYRDEMKEELMPGYKRSREGAVDVLEKFMTKGEFQRFDKWFEGLEIKPEPPRPFRKKRKVRATIGGSEPAF